MFPLSAYSPRARSPPTGQVYSSITQHARRSTSFKGRPRELTTSFIGGLRLFNKAKEHMMQFPNLLVKVYLIPGGEMVSRLAHESFSRLMEEHEEFKMASYHGMNRYDQQWHLVLIGPPHAFAQFRQEQERILQQAHAQEISVPEQSLLPLVARYWKREAQMMATGQSFVKYHYPAASGHSKQQKKKKKRR